MDAPRTALAAAGLDPSLELVRAEGAADAWLGDTVVIRLQRGDRAAGLEREARLASLLSPDALTPAVIAHGGTDDVSWLISRRVQGVALGFAWGEMSVADRRRATLQLAGALRTLHRTVASDLPTDEDMRPPHVLPLPRAIEQAEQVRDLLDRGVYEDAVALMSERWDAFDDEDRGLVHGDPHLTNVLWDGAGVTAVLDLEWARVSWLHVDLEILLHVAAEPSRFLSGPDATGVRAWDYRMVPAWLADGYPELFAHPRLHDRLVVLCADRMFGLLVDEPTSQEPAGTLRALLDGKSHLHKLLT